MKVKLGFMCTSAKEHVKHSLQQHSLFLIQKAQTNRVLDRADNDNGSQLFGCRINPIEKGMEACEIVYFIPEDW